MEWIREWIFQIATIIVLGAICDIIMIEGEMKKYVKPVLGVVLILTVIRPITSASGNILRVNMLQDSINSSFETTTEAEEKQISHIADMYEKNLGKKIEETISDKFNTKLSVTVLADREKGNLGNVKSIDIAALVGEGEMINTESIKRHIEEVFGIDRNCITVTLTERGES